MYVSNNNGCYQCKKCGAKGSWKNLTEKLGDFSHTRLAENGQTEYQAVLDTGKDQELSLIYLPGPLPDRIKEYLLSENRGLTQETISKFEIGWDGNSITIPVYNSNGKLINIRHRRDPEKVDGPKMWNEKGGKGSLFNIKELIDQRTKGGQILLVEGEFDCMIACQNGFPAISGTAGAQTFKEEWIKEFEGIQTVNICYDTDQAGKDGAYHISSLLKEKARIIDLPCVNEEKVDLTIYFAKQKHTPDEFQKLLDEAKPYKETDDFELSDGNFDFLIHPALDYYNDTLFLSLSLPVKREGKENIEKVVITSDRERAIVKEGTFVVDDQLYNLRKVAEIKGTRRWKVQDIRSFLADKEVTSPALAFVEIRNTLLKFVDFRKETDADIVALWIIGTYCFPIFDTFPYLYFLGVKRSGKTKTLLLINQLAFNAILSSNISSPVLFRLVEAQRCTLSLDESELLFDKNQKEELRELLNAGYKRGAPVYRISKVKDDLNIGCFEVYGPKAIANISGLDTVLEDRAITITMVRTTNSVKGNLAVTEGAAEWFYLRSLLYRFALLYAPLIASFYNSDPEVNALINRQNELWKPLLSIAKVIDREFGGLFERMKNEAVTRSEEISGNDLEDFDSAILFALRQLTDKDNDTILTNKEIHKKASEFLEEDQRKYLTSRGVGSALKRFGIRGKKIQGNWRYSIRQEIINDLLKRYGFPME